MPNQPATPVHWEAVKVKAHDNDETITDVIVRALKRYLRD